MKKKIGLSLLVLSLCATSYALGFSFRGTNMRCHYPKFSAPIILIIAIEIFRKFLMQKKRQLKPCMM